MLRNQAIKLGGLGLVVFSCVSALVGCGGDTTGTGGTGGSGTTTTTTGTPTSTTTTTTTTTTTGATTTSTTTGGTTTSTGGGSTFPCTSPIKAPASGKITDFSVTAGTPTAITWPGEGDFSGGVFTYSATDITADVTAMDLHITGSMLKNYDGFGLWIIKCTDASAFKGVSFKIKAAKAVDLTFSIQTNSTTAPDATGMKGTCIPADPLKPWESCTPPSKSISVTTDVSTVSVLWGDTAGGLPAASAVADPKEITGFQWAFKYDGMTAYDADVTVDDVVFIP